MATNLAIDADLLNKALEIGGEKTKKATVNKALREFMRSSRSPITIRGGLLGEQVLTASEVDRLADVPSRDELIARLMGQLLAPITSLAYVLDAPVASLARVLQGKIDATANQEG